jgi:glutamate-ammonia-ligase adenylyltransferase
MLEEYLQVQGREWERFAWLKSRVVAPRGRWPRTARPAAALAGDAFVYRRYLDYGVFEGLRQLHRKIREEAQRRAAGRPERANDVKLSRGGIREIEFIVQLMLVVRGGQFPEIRTRSHAARPAASWPPRGLMKPEAATRLAAAYTFLRRVEHRIQYLDDAADPSAAQRRRPTCAGSPDSLGLVCKPGACELLDQLCEVRERRRRRVRRPAARRPGQHGQRRAAARVAAAARGVDSEPCSNACRPGWRTRLRPGSQQPRVQACATRAGCAWAA